MTRNMPLSDDQIFTLMKTLLQKAQRYCGAHMSEEEWNIWNKDFNTVLHELEYREMDKD